MRYIDSLLCFALILCKMTRDIDRVFDWHRNQWPGHYVLYYTSDVFFGANYANL